MTMWAAYLAARRAAEETWTEGDPSPILVAVAKVTGIQLLSLAAEVEGFHGFEPIDDGYEATAWFCAWGTMGRPDWAAAGGG
jgi:hypothetical protein